MSLRQRALVLLACPRSSGSLIAPQERARYSLSRCCIGTFKSSNRRQDCRRSLRLRTSSTEFGDGHTRGLGRASAKVKDTAAPDDKLPLPIRIRTQHGVSYGEIIKIVGAGEALGDWNPDQAPGMTWSEGDEWAVDLQVPPGSYDFKCVVTRADGSIAEWEPGENRTLSVPEPQDCSRPIMEVVCPWSNTLATFMSFDEDDATARLESSQTGQAIQVSESSANSTENPAAGSPKNDSQGLASLDSGIKGDRLLVEDKLDAVAQAMQLDQTSKVDKFKNGSSGSHSQIRNGHTENCASVGSDQRINSNGRQGLSSAGSDSGVADTYQIDSNLQVASGSADRGLQETGNSGLRGVQETSDVSSPTKPFKQPGTLAQALAGLLGLLALPVVFWSEFTLKQTGCGLPPGPSGYLGAAEGLSYLTVFGLTLWSLIRKVTKGRGLPRGPAGLLGAAEGLSYSAAIIGSLVLGFQYKEYGYIPSALPDSRCFGSEGSSRDSEFSLPKLPFIFSKDFRSGFISGSSLGDLTSSSADADIDKETDGTVVEKLTSSVKGLQRMFMSDPNSEMEYASSGAEDGLSSAELEPVVEELENAAARLSEFFASFWQKLPNSGLNGARMQSQPSSLSSILTPAAEETRLIYENASADIFQHWDAAQGYEQSSELPLRFVGIEMSFAATANNAASTANNVTQHIQSGIIQLESAAIAVEESAEDLSKVAAQRTEPNSTELQEAGVDLEGTLERAEESVSILPWVEPLVEELETQSVDLQNNENNSDEVSSLRGAEDDLAEALSVDTSVIPKAKSMAAKIASNPGSSNEVVKASENAAKAVVATLGDMKSLLDDARTILDGP